MYELSLLQALRMKGRATPATLVASTGFAEPEVEQVLADLRERGAISGSPAVRATPQGLEQLATLVAQERESVDTLALEAAYRAFGDINTEVKATVSAWQLLPGGETNDHTDLDYDRGVVERLVAVHRRFQPVLAELVRIVPRLAHYPVRFDQAIAKVQAGEHTFVARPIEDSFHTVWFELHEDLLGLLALSRAEEARAGRA